MASRLATVGLAALPLALSPGVAMPADPTALYSLKVSELPMPKSQPPQPEAPASDPKLPERSHG